MPREVKSSTIICWSRGTPCSLGRILDFSGLRACLWSVFAVLRSVLLRLLAWLPIELNIYAMIWQFAELQAATNKKKKKKKKTVPSSLHGESSLSTISKITTKTQLTTFAPLDSINHQANYTQGNYKGFSVIQFKFPIPWCLLVSQFDCQYIYFISLTILNHWLFLIP